MRRRFGPEMPVGAARPSRRPSSGFIANASEAERERIWLEVNAPSFPKDVPQVSTRFARPQDAECFVGSLRAYCKRLGRGVGPAYRSAAGNHAGNRHRLYGGTLFGRPRRNPTGQQLHRQCLYQHALALSKPSDCRSLGFQAETRPTCR